MKKIHIVLISLLLISVLVGGFALYKIISEINEVNRAEELSNEFLEYSPDKDINSQLSYKEIFDSFKPQLLELKNVNPHVVGWIYIPGTNIN